jgi:hypothetical protein
MYVKQDYMKIINYIFITSVLAVVSFSACHTRGQKSEANSVTFDSLKLVKVYHLNNDSTQPSCNLKILFVFPAKGLPEKQLADLKASFISSVFDQAYADSTPQAAAQNYVRDYVKTYQEDAKLFYSETNDGEDPKDYYSYFETLTNRILYNKSDLLSFQVEQLNYKGGANSFTSFRNYVVYLKTGEFLTEDAIFKPGYDRALRPLFINKLLQQNNVKNISELEDLGYFGIDEISPNHNFLIGDDGITYIFNKGESSALSLSEIRIKFSFDEIEPFLKPNSPIQSLIKE